jgi:hypothetical protein
MTTVKIGSQTLDRVKDYSYLGINVTSNGTFSSCKDTLKSKGQKALNKLKGLIGGNTINKALALKLFDQLIFPILSYGCEIWGAEDFMTLLKQGNVKVMDDIYNKLPQEKLNIHFCKYLLGTTSKATNMAVIGELGRFPLYIRIISQMVKYYQRVSKMQDGSLLKEALSEMENCVSKGQKSWLSVVKFIMNKLNIVIDSNAMNRNIAKEIRVKLENIFKLYWRGTINKEGGKLDVLKLIESDFEFQDYLNCNLSRDYQVAITKIRLSNHRLRIETGRYERPYLPREDRLCICKKSVEDEAHFLFQCPLLAGERLLYLGCDYFDGPHKDLLQKCLGSWKMTSPKNIGKFICAGIEKRNNLLPK